jgi:hypothetical protein
LVRLARYHVVTPLSGSTLKAPGKTPDLQKKGAPFGAPSQPFSLSDLPDILWNLWVRERSNPVNSVSLPIGRQAHPKRWLAPGKAPRPKARQVRQGGSHTAKGKPMGALRIEARLAQNGKQEFEA